MPIIHVHALEIGVAQIDVTPEYPVRLSGFGFRREESEGITHRIWAKALAIKDSTEGLAIMITVDNLGIPAVMTQQVAQRLNQTIGLALERLAITATHTHSAPMLTQVAPTLFSLPIPTEHQHHIDRYTRELTDWLEEVALQAFEDLQHGRLEWGTGEVTFAKNRRTVGGPVDHDMPMMVIRNQENGIRGIWFNYACHCVTLSHNHISGDWAGSAQIEIQKRHPEAIVLASIGCGADQNPNSDVTGDKVEVADAQGIEIADEVDRLLSETLKPLEGPLSIRLKGIPLSFETPRTREEWESRTKQTGAVAYHAKVNLARLDRGETLPKHIDYPIQSWLFGDALAMVFLPGEVVVDYSLRLKQEFDERRLWINAYANDVPCYIPSERILTEGGYEGGGAMIYYDRPNKFAPGLEQQIIDVIHEHIPDTFKADSRTEGSHALPPEASLRSMQLSPGMQIELVATEPLVIDPVAIDWDTFGRLWVVEMNDYPLGMQGGYEPGGRIKILTDSNKDGHYDHASIFMDGLAFPTGVTTWGNGALISAAPDLIYAEDTNGDGIADKKETWFTGFATENYQARINSISLGLDNWLYGANGLIGGDILPVASRKATDRTQAAISIRNHDFRFNPWSGIFETVSGLTQQGRVRDDFGNWFGCSNGSLIYHFPVTSSMLHRNPHLILPPAKQFSWKERDANQLYPISTPLERFNDIHHLNRVTSACGLGIYRDQLMGPTFEGNAFTCEPVHNLVRRTILERHGTSFSGRRADGEQASEFLASTDQWFRPSQVRTGPDGALWIVDMYRFLMEHPIWIRPDRMAKLDPRAGDEMGRIYRVYPQNQRPPIWQGIRKRPATATDKCEDIPTSAYTTAMESSNGIIRDLAHQHLLLRKDTSSTETLTRLASQSPNPAVRLQSLSVLAGMHSLTPEHVLRALNDEHPGVKAQAANLAESFIGKHNEIIPTLLTLLKDPDDQVRTRAVASLHGVRKNNVTMPNDKEVGFAIGHFLLQNTTDPYATAAAWSASSPFMQQIGEVLLNTDASAATKIETLLPTFIRMADSQEQDTQMADIAWHISMDGHDGNVSLQTISRLVAFVEHSRKWNLKYWIDSQSPGSPYTDIRKGFLNILDKARELATDTTIPPEMREQCIELLGRNPRKEMEDLNVLLSLVDEKDSLPFSTSIFTAFARFDLKTLPERFMHRWNEATPGIRRSMIHVLLQRPLWTSALLKYAMDHPDIWNTIPSTRRTALLRHPDPEIKSIAEHLQNQIKHAGRDQILAHYKPSAQLPGNATRGKEWFSHRCSNCHLLEGLGREVGPDLLNLSDKTPEALMLSIIDPNRAVLDQYTVYEFETKDERSLAGSIIQESKVGIRIRTANGEEVSINRDNISSSRATGLSLMPEGLESGLSLQDMADLTSFIAQARSVDEPPPRDPGVIAAYLLNDDVPSEEREAAIKIHYMLAVELIREMVRDLPPGTSEEYRRIPWIWRLAIQAGRENNTNRLRRMLDQSLPQSGEALRDWQAVVIGGGLINGLSQIDIWPKRRLRNLVQNQPDLANRFELALLHSFKMADDKKTHSGTRYDALRMMAMAEPAKAIPHLSRYLHSTTEIELQMGAISGLADIQQPDAFIALEKAIPMLSGNNLKIAQEGIRRLKSTFH